MPICAPPQGFLDVSKILWRHHEKVRDLRSQLRQHGLEIDGKDAEGLDAGRAHFVQALLHAFLLGQLPGFVLVYIFVHAVGQGHDLAHHLAEFALSIQRGDAGQRLAQLLEQRLVASGYGAQATVKPLGDKACGTAGNVDVFADQVGVHARHEVVGVEVDIFITLRELGGQVVAQPFGVHLQAQVLERIQPRAAAFAHFFAVVHRHETVHEHVVGHLAA